MSNNTQNVKETAEEGDQVDDIVGLPICPYCKKEMYLSVIATSNGCGESFETTIWECACMDYELENKRKESA